MVEDGGCDKLCPEVLECGHPCPSKSTVQVINIICYSRDLLQDGAIHTRIQKSCATSHALSFIRAVTAVDVVVSKYVTKFQYNFRSRFDTCCRTVARAICLLRVSWSSVVTRNKSRATCLKKNSAAKRRARTKCRAATDAQSTVARCVPRPVTSTSNTCCRVAIT